MSAAVPAAPTGYTQLSLAGATVVARTDAVDGITAAFATARTLHCWAATTPGARPFSGRATAWAAALPGSATTVVVRHARHGGLLARATGDLFRWPSRAPWELDASRRLLAGGVPTPTVVAYALYPAGLGFCRADVATGLLPDGADFPAFWGSADSTARRDAIAAVGTLLRRLSALGAHHEDLNIKNLHLARTSGGLVAYALDVDRVVFGHAVDAARARNLARLTRSLEKWRVQQGLEVDESTRAAIAQAAMEPQP
ncbi:MAG: hypothetical protein KF709_03185 [Gemmatimonadaceae bacterium]|nr:hypothetical protein [Gemmatimonadaceae bacterium]